MEQRGYGHGGSTERERTLWEGKRENVMREYLSRKETEDREKRE